MHGKWNNSFNKNIYLEDKGTSVQSDKQKRMENNISSFGMKKKCNN